MFSFKGLSVVLVAALTIAGVVGEVAAKDTGDASGSATRLELRGQSAVAQTRRLRRDADFHQDDGPSCRCRRTACRSGIERIYRVGAPRADVQPTSDRCALEVSRRATRLCTRRHNFALVDRPTDQTGRPGISRVRGGAGAPMRFVPTAWRLAGLLEGDDSSGISGAAEKWNVGRIGRILPENKVPPEYGDHQFEKCSAEVDLGAAR
jgi:hypothetical protein